MAKNLTPQPDMETLRDLLSPYLDDEVTEEERAQVEAALAESPALRQELADLRQTVALVSALPRVPAPRPFTLSEADVQAVAPKPRKTFGLPAWLGGFAAAAALLVCVLAIGGMFFVGQFSGGAVGDIALAPQQAEPETIMETVVVEKEMAEEAAAEEPAPATVYEQEEAAEEAAPAEVEAPAAESEMVIESVEVEKEVEKEGVVIEEKAETTPPQAAEAEEAESLAGADDAQNRLEAPPTATPAPVGTALPTPTAAPVMAQALPEEDEETVEQDMADRAGEGVVEKEAPLQKEATGTAAPTPTIVALLTILPSDTPVSTATPVSKATAPPTGSPDPATPYRTLVTSLMVVGIILMMLAAAWIILWRRHRKK